MPLGEELIYFDWLEPLRELPRIESYLTKTGKK
jgi:hypothetical protein